MLPVSITNALRVASIKLMNFLTIWRKIKPLQSVEIMSVISKRVLLLNLK